ncbi:hypothetical protein QSE00_21935 [Arenibacter sp. M-2]|uniref:hypothetical protein n=1 Tax=unclassified Arenibacter TaxID=2615047 RepID=UPI000D75C82A|nr:MULTISPECIES: hypothetical protein [unclassified Arenibacter]MDL5514488.1 hypothetical protein [Arenibacter sp. M-2]PXX28379.1 hypothetical protein C7972_105234 [Arenibacter sp. ARW7G5Y1]
MKILYVIGAFVFLVFCAGKNDMPKLQGTQIRVVNKTNESFTNVVLFSMKFEDLRPNDTTAYKALNYDQLTDDPLIYCSIGDKNYARYLKIPDSKVENFTYTLDSIHDGILYVGSIKEN